MARLNSLLLNLSSALLVVRDVRWSAIRSQAQHIIPTLSHDSHKGQMGRIGVIGGSQDYTGAPFYASKAALLFGGDLVFVFCAEGALLPIKSYSPEFMVTALYDDEAERRRRDVSVCGRRMSDDEEEEEDEGRDNHGGEGARKRGRFETEEEEKSRREKKVAAVMLEKMQTYMWRLHVLVMGPGLGRAMHLVPGYLGVIELAVSENKPLVLDADALWLVCHRLDAVRGHKSCVLTPNAREFSMLVDRSLRDVEVAIAEVSAREPQSQSELESGDGAIVTPSGTVTESSAVPETCMASQQKTAHSSQEGKGFLVTEFSRQELESLREELRGGARGAEDGEKDGEEEEARRLLQLRALCRSLGGVTVLLKGRLDVVSAGEDVLRLVGEEGSPRRCGGQGDILSGAVAVALHWALNLPHPTLAASSLSPSFSSDLPSTMVASLLAAFATKRAAQQAFAQKGRATTSPDILEHLGPALLAMELDTGEKDVQDCVTTITSGNVPKN